MEIQSLVNQTLETLKSLIKPKEGGIIELTPDMTGTILHLGGKPFYIEMLRTKQRIGSGYLLISNDKKFIWVVGRVAFGRLMLVQRLDFWGIPKKAFTVEELDLDYEENPSSLYNELLELIKELVVFENDEYYNLITSYVLYTWIHPVFTRKPFLFVTGFYGTGKSVIASIIRQLGRYTTDLFSEISRTNVWEGGALKSVFLIDEAEVLNARTRQYLRKIFDEGITVSKMLADIYGWNMLNLIISNPVVVAGTHLPTDPALLSRGIIIKMHYGKPSKRVDYLLEKAKPLRTRIFLTMVRNWAKIQEIYKNIMFDLPDKDLHERSYDIYSVLATIDKFCNKKPDYLVDILEESRTYSLHTVLANRIIATVMQKLKKRIIKGTDIVAVSTKELQDLLFEMAKEFKLTESQVRYIFQYFVSASIPCEIEGELGECFKLSDIIASLKFFAKPKLRIRGNKIETL